MNHFSFKLSRSLLSTLNTLSALCPNRERLGHKEKRRLAALAHADLVDALRDPRRPWSRSRRGRPSAAWPQRGTGRRPMRCATLAARPTGARALSSDLFDYRLVPTESSCATAARLPGAAAPHRPTAWRSVIVRCGTDKKCLSIGTGREAHQAAHGHGSMHGSGVIIFNLIIS